MLGARCDYQVPRKGGSCLASTRKDPGRRIQSRRTNNSGLGVRARRGWAVVPCHPRNRTRGTCPAHNSPPNPFAVHCEISADTSESDGLVPSTTAILGHEPEAQTEVHLPFSNYARSGHCKWDRCALGQRATSWFQRRGDRQLHDEKRVPTMHPRGPSGKTATSQDLVRR